MAFAGAVEPAPRPNRRPTPKVEAGGDYTHWIPFFPPPTPETNAMAIDFYCTCGRLLKGPDGSGGKTVRCPACKAAIIVPEPNAPDLTAVTTGDSTRLQSSSGWSWFGSPARNADASPSLNPARVLLMIAAVIATLFMIGAGQSGDAVAHTAAICLVVALAGIACSKPRP
jgi:hypothetical protein